MTDAPAIMAITSQLPWPLDRGGHLRSFHIMRSLARHFPLTLVTSLSSSDPVDLAPFLASGITLQSATTRTNGSFLRELPQVLSSALAGEPYVCFRRHDRPAIRQAIRAELARVRPSLAYLDHLDSIVFADLLAGIPTIVDLHNVYSTLVRRTAAESTGLRRSYLHRESRLLASMERRAAELADGLFAVSEEDRVHFAGLSETPVHLIPNGVDCAAYEDLPTGGRSGPPLILYVGTLSWGPNAAAALHLVRNVLPQIRQTIPDALVRIVGRQPPADLLALHGNPGVEVTGGVDDVRPHLRAAHVLAVPLEAGGGSPLKNLQAFAAGLPLVSAPGRWAGVDGPARPDPG